MIEQDKKQDFMEIEILRYRPEKDQKPWLATYSVPIEHDWVVLDALEYIHENIDSSLAFRASCHMAICGSCGVMVDGTPVLACHTFLRDYQDKGKITIEPLQNFPIERDLVVVLDEAIAKFESIKPYIIKGENVPLENGPHRQTPNQMDKYHQFSMCINCMLCYAACPQIGMHKDFIGPGALATAHRYNLDNRDEGFDIRKHICAGEDGVWHCTYVGACSEVCPKQVDPGAAIQQMKIGHSIDYFLSFIKPSTKNKEAKND